jgi:hypothetical protein
MIMGKFKNGRNKTPPFVMLRKDVITSEQYASLSYKAIKLLIDVLEQYNGNNNGDLCITMSVMKKKGWRSSGTLHSAKNELRDKGWIVLTRQGGRHKCSLFAVTMHPIDECGGKLEVRSTRTASNLWKKKN